MTKIHPAHYEQAAFIEQEISNRLLDKISSLNIHAQTILDIGCATGMQCVSLQKIFPHAHIIGLDIDMDMLDFASKLQDVDFVCANATSLPFKKQTFDLIFSNCCLPLLCELESTFFLEIKRILQPNGALLCSTFGPNTFIELQKNNWLDMHIIGDFLLQHFKDPVLETDQLTFNYPDGLTLKQDLDRTGYNIDLSNLVLNEQQDISIEAIYIYAQQNIHSQYKDVDGKTYINIDSLEHL